MPFLALLPRINDIAVAVINNHWEVINIFHRPCGPISFHYCSDFQPTGTSDHARRHDGVDC